MIGFCRFISRKRFELLDLPWFFFCGWVAGSDYAPTWWLAPAAAVYVAISMSSYVIAGGKRGIGA